MSIVKDFKFGLIYAEDFEKTKSFYEKYFGFKEEFKMDDTNLGPQTWGKMGDVGMWIGGGFKRTDMTENTCRSGIMLGVESTGQLFKELKAGNVKTLQNEPVEMQEGVYWLQFEDPSGNIIEVLGAK